MEALRRIALTGALISLVSCHFGPVEHLDAWDQLPPEVQRERLVMDAKDFIHARQFRIESRSFPYDCSGYVGAILYENGIDVFKGATELQIRGNGVQIIREFVSRYGTIRKAGVTEPGDLVFFSNTYDRNRDGHFNDGWTHIGIVESVDSAGTITFLHVMNGRVRRNVMNVSLPYLHETDRGEEINSYLRRRRSGDRPGVAYLSGSLVSGFGSLIRQN